MVLACSGVALGLSACGMFGEKTAHIAPSSQMEFDPYANTWRQSGRVVTPPPSQPNAALAQQQPEESTLDKAGRAMGETASAVGRAVKKPLEWLPFGKKEAEGPAVDVSNTTVQ
jgi:hypothetical protein